MNTVRDSAIRHLAASDEGRLVAAALFESTVQIWSWEAKRQLGEFETILDFGGERLALAGKVRSCITGSWTKGLASYSIPEGKVQWHRKDLRHVQEISLSASEEKIYCGLEEGPLQIIETSTGSTLDKIRGASCVFASPFSPYRLIAMRGRYLVRGPNEFEIRPASFALNSAALSAEAVCISEPKAGIRCVDLESQNLLWHHESLSSSHLAFNISDQRFYCVAVRDKPTVTRSLVRLAADITSCENFASLGGCWDSAFTPSGKILVTVQGNVYETSTGSVLAHLDFPQKDYPASHAEA